MLPSKVRDTSRRDHPKQSDKYDRMHDQIRMTQVVNQLRRAIVPWSWLLPWSLSLLASLLLVRHIFAQRQISLTTPVGYGAIATVLVLGLLAVPLTGLSSAVLFLLLGLQLRDKVFTALAIFSIPLFISAYYYSLSVSLLEKSLLLTALGAVLLLARWGLNRYLSQPSSVTSQEAL